MPHQLLPQPKASVVMPVYNAERYLKAAIESILNQSFRDFELIIINDGSTDRSVSIIESFNDQRIRLIHNKKNRGIVYTLNKGLKETNGKYIIRMDNDDISLPERFAKQITFMDNNPEIGLCGSELQTIDENGNKGAVWSYNLDNKSLKISLLFGTTFFHPTVIMRKRILTKHNLTYRETYLHTEDYDLWTRMAEVTMVANIPEVLLLYRCHSNQISTANNALQLENANQVRYNLLRKLDITPTEDEKRAHILLCSMEITDPVSDYLICDAWLHKLHKANRKIGRYDRKAFKKYAFEKWHYVFGSINQSPVKKIPLLLKSKFLSLHDTLTFLIRTIIGQFV